MTGVRKVKSTIHKTNKNVSILTYTLRQMRNHKTSYLFVAPYMLIFLLFTVLPVIVSLYLSLTSFNILEPPIFIGMNNYIRMFLEDDIFLTALKNTILIAIVTGPGGYFLCLMFAWFINELKPGLRAFVTLLFYAPSISGNVFLIWGVMFNGDSYGYVNGILLRLGILHEPVLWFQDPEYMLGLIMMVALWASLSTSFLAFIAGFQGIDKMYYEAAAIDGIKNRWQELWFVTLPSMRPQMLFGAVMSITASFGAGAIVTALAGVPSTDYAAHTIVNHLEDYGGVRFEMGYASSMATLLFFMMMGTNLVVRRLISKVGE